MLEEILSDLYESEEDQISATRRLLELCYNPSVLVELGNHETALTVLSRILLEESKQLNDLPTTIASIFFLFSTSPPLQEVLRRHKAGDAVFRQLEFELDRRAPVLQEAMTRKWQEYHASRTASIVAELNQDQMKVERQNRLLFMCVRILANLGIDRTVEKKMVNRGVIPLLAASLVREFEPLRLAVLEWLLRLSVVESYKDEILKAGIPGKLSEICAANCQLLVIKVLTNLAFCPEARTQISECRNFHRSAVEMLRVPELRAAVVKLLAIISEDKEISESLALVEDTPQMLLSLAVGLPEKSPITRELAGLLANVAHTNRGAVALAGNPLIVDFFLRACTLADALALRVVKVVTGSLTAASALLTLLRKSPGWQDALAAAGATAGVVCDDGETPVYALEEALGIFGNLGEAGLKNVDGKVQNLLLRGLRSEVAEVKLEAVMAVGSLVNEVNGEISEAVVRMFAVTECPDTLNQCMHALIKVDAKLVDPALPKAAEKLYALLRSSTEELRSRAELLCERFGDDERLKAAQFAAWNGELVVEDEGDFDNDDDDDLGRYWAAPSLWSCTRLLAEAARDLPVFAEELEMRLMVEAEYFKPTELVSAMELLRSRGSVVTRSVAQRVLKSPGPLTPHQRLAVGRNLTDADFSELVIKSTDFKNLNEPDLLTIVFEAKNRRICLEPEAVLAALTSSPAKFTAARIANLLADFPPGQTDLDVLLPRILVDFVSLRPEHSLIMLSIMRSHAVKDKQSVVELLASDVAAGLAEFQPAQLLMTFDCAVEFQLWSLLADVTPRLVTHLPELESSDVLSVLRLLKNAKMTAILPDIIPAISKAKSRFRPVQALELLGLTRGQWTQELLNGVSESLAELPPAEKVEVLKLLVLDGLGEKTKKLFDTIAASLNFNDASSSLVFPLLEMLVAKEVGGHVRRRIIKSLRTREADLSIDNRVALLFLESQRSAQRAEVKAPVPVTGLAAIRDSRTLQRLLVLLTRGQVAVDHPELEASLASALSQSPSPSLLTTALAAGVSDDSLVKAVAEKLTMLSHRMTGKELTRALVVLTQKSELSSAKSLWPSLAMKLNELSLENLMSCVWATKTLGIPIDENFFRLLLKKSGEAEAEELVKHVSALQACGVWEELEPTLQHKIWRLVEAPEGLRPPTPRRSTAPERKRKPLNAVDDVSTGTQASRQFIDLVKKM